MKNPQYACEVCGHPAKKNYALCPHCLKKHKQLTCCPACSTWNLSMDSKCKKCGSGLQDFMQQQPVSVEPKSKKGQFNCDIRGQLTEKNYALCPPCIRRNNAGQLTKCQVCLTWNFVRDLRCKRCDSDLHDREVSIAHTVALAAATKAQNTAIAKVRTQAQKNRIISLPNSAPLAESRLQKATVQISALIAAQN